MEGKKDVGCAVFKVWLYAGISMGAGFVIWDCIKEMYDSARTIAGSTNKKED